MGSRADSDGLEAIAVAAKRPVHSPERKVFSGVVLSSCSFSDRLRYCQWCLGNVVGVWGMSILDVMRQLGYA